MTRPFEMSPSRHAGVVLVVGAAATLTALFAGAAAVTAALIRHALGGRP
jgi:hypothetical protein